MDKKPFITLEPHSREAFNDSIKGFIESGLYDAIKKILSGYQHAQENIALGNA